MVLISGADEGPQEFGSSDSLFSQLYVVESLLGCYQLHGAESQSERRFMGKL